MRFDGRAGVFAGMLLLMGMLLPLVAMSALAPEQLGRLQARLASWQALPAATRQQQREQMRAWLALPAERQQALREAAAAYARLTPTEQMALRQRFADLAPDQQYGWRLGASLGPWYPRLQPLLGWVPEAERAPLLQMLHQMSPQELEVLGRLAFSTPAQKRAQLRAELLQQPAAGRLEWMLAELERQ